MTSELRDPLRTIATITEPLACYLKASNSLEWEKPKSRQSEALGVVQTPFVGGTQRAQLGVWILHALTTTLDPTLSLKQSRKSLVVVPGSDNNLL